MFRKKWIFSYMIFAFLINLLAPVAFSQKAENNGQVSSMAMKKKSETAPIVTLNNVILTANSTIKSDFRVNDDANTRDQTSPAVAVDSSGNSVVSWVDEKETASDIIARLYDENGEPKNASFLIESGDGASLLGPSVAMAKSGEFIITFQVVNGGFSNINTRRYSQTGQWISDVNSPVQGEWGSEPSVAIANSGNFILVYCDDVFDVDYTDLFAQLYDSLGQEITSIATHTAAENDQVRGIAGFDGNDNFVIAWLDGRDQNRYDVYARRYKSDGQAKWQDFKVNDDTGGADHFGVDIAVANDGSFIICWSDNRNNNSDIYAQMYGRFGAKIGDNFKVNDDEGDYNQCCPAIAVNDSGDFIIVWQDNRNGDDDIYGQKYSADGTPIGSNYKVNTDAGGAYQRVPDVAIAKDRVYLVWQDNRTEGQGWDIFAKIESFYQLPEPTTIISLVDTTAFSGQTADIPIVVSTDSSIGFAQFVVEFDSSIIEFSDAQTGADASNFQISGINTNLSFAPTHFDANKNILVQISGGGSSSFSGQNLQIIILQFDVVGAAGDSTKLYFDQGTNHTFLTTTNLYDINDGEIVFNSGSLKIPETMAISGFVLYGGSGNAVPDAEISLDSQSTVSTNASGFYSFASVIPGSHTLSAAKNYDENTAITGADALAVLQSLAFILQLTDEQKLAADVTMDGNITGADAMAILRYLAFYQTNIAQTGNWYFSPQDTTIDVNADVTVDFKGYVKGDANLSWTSAAPMAKTGQDIGVFNLGFGTPIKSENKQIAIPMILDTKREKLQTLLFSLKYPASLLKFERIEWAQEMDNFQKASNSEKSGELHLAMAASQGIMCNGEIGHLIFQKISDRKELMEVQFTRTVINDAEQKDLAKLMLDQNLTEVPQQFGLFQNYPNPFNAETVIKYQLAKDVHVKVAIYNSRGQIIRTLADEVQKTGIHTIRWDGKDDDNLTVVSGIYLIKVEAGRFSDSKKLIFLK